MSDTIKHYKVASEFENINVGGMLFMNRHYATSDPKEQETLSSWPGVSEIKAEETPAPQVQEKSSNVQKISIGTEAILAKAVAAAASKK